MGKGGTRVIDFQFQYRNHSPPNWTDFFFVLMARISLFHLFLPPSRQLENVPVRFLLNATVYNCEAVAIVFY